MNDRWGIVYASVDGHTREICDTLTTLLHARQKKVEMFPVEAFHKKITDYDTLIIGASIRYGRHSKTIKRFVEMHKEDLQKINTAFFSVNLVARKKEKSTPETNPYLIKFLKETKWVPHLTEVFAGKLDYSLYSFFDKIIIRLIMKITHGPTNSDTPIDYTDWNKVKEFSEKICAINNLQHSEVRQKN